MDFRKTSEFYWNTKKIILIAIILIAIFQLIAVYSFESAYWILSEYLWWGFVFIGLFEAINIAKRNFFKSWKSAIDFRLETSFDLLNSHLQYYSTVFNVKDKDKKALSVEHYKMLENWENYYIHHWSQLYEFIISKIDSNPKSSNWTEDAKKQILIKSNLITNTDGLILQSKNDLIKAVNRYHETWLTYREYENSKKDHPIRQFMIPLTPYLLSLIIAIQLGNVTNKLMDIINT